MKLSIKADFIFPITKKIGYSLFLVILFLFLSSCGTATQTQQTIQQKTLPEKIESPFKKNVVDDKYNYPNIPANFLPYLILNNYEINNNINDFYSGSLDYETKAFYDLYFFLSDIKKYSFQQVLANKNNFLPRLNTALQLTKILVEKFKSYNQYFEAAYFNCLDEGFANLYNLILSWDKYSQNQKVMVFYKIANSFYLSQETKLFDFSLSILDEALLLYQADFIYFLKAKFLINKIELDLALKNISDASANLTDPNNEQPIFYYYYSLRKNKFDYTYTFKFQIDKQIDRFKLKLFAPYETKSQNIENIIVKDNGIVIPFNLETNEFKTNTLEIIIENMNKGTHIIELHYIMKKIPRKYDLYKINGLSILDYTYDSPLLINGIKPTAMFDFDQQNVKRYINEIQESIPEKYKTDLLYIVTTTFLYTVNKLAYNKELLLNPNLKDNYDKKLGLDANRAILYPEMSTCGNYATLLVTLLRSFGIPAYYVYGPVYKNPHHAWVKFYDTFGNAYILDPTNGDPIGENGTDTLLYMLFNPSNRIEEALLDQNIPLSPDFNQGSIFYSYIGGAISSVNFSAGLNLLKE